MKLLSSSVQETIQIGICLGRQLKRGDVIAFTGNLAAGKTSLTKGIAESLGIEEEVTSPTFTILSEYEGRIPLYHFDLYRLSSFDDFLDLGGDEYMSGDGVCVIEWSEKIFKHLPQKRIVININLLSDDKREITISNCPTSYLEEISNLPLASLYN